MQQETLTTSHIREIASFFDRVLANIKSGDLPEASSMLTALFNRAERGDAQELAQKPWFFGRLQAVCAALDVVGQPGKALRLETAQRLHQLRSLYAPEKFKIHLEPEDIQLLTQPPGKEDGILLQRCTEFFSLFGVEEHHVAALSVEVLRQAWSRRANLLSEPFFKHFSWRFKDDPIAGIQWLADGLWSKHHVNDQGVPQTTDAVPPELTALRDQLPNGVADREIILFRGTRSREARIRWDYDPTLNLWLPLGINYAKGVRELTVVLDNTSNIRYWGELPDKEVLSTLNERHGELTLVTRSQPKGTFRASSSKSEGNQEFRSVENGLEIGRFKVGTNGLLMAASIGSDPKFHPLVKLVQRDDRGRIVNIIDTASYITAAKIAANCTNEHPEVWLEGIIVDGSLIIPGRSVRRDGKHSYAFQTSEAVQGVEIKVLYGKDAVPLRMIYQTEPPQVVHPKLITLGGGEDASQVVHCSDSLIRYETLKEALKQRTKDTERVRVTRIPVRRFEGDPARRLSVGDCVIEIPAALLPKDLPDSIMSEVIFNLKDGEPTPEKILVGEYRPIGSKKLGAERFVVKKSFKLEKVPDANRYYRSVGTKVWLPTIQREEGAVAKGTRGVFFAFSDEISIPAPLLRRYELTDVDPRIYADRKNGLHNRINRLVFTRHDGSVVEMTVLREKGKSVGLSISVDGGEPEIERKYTIRRGDQVAFASWKPPTYRQLVTMAKRGPIEFEFRINKRREIWIDTHQYRFPDSKPYDRMRAMVSLDADTQLVFSEESNYGIVT